MEGLVRLQELSAVSGPGIRRSGDRGRGRANANLSVVEGLPIRGDGLSSARDQAGPGFRARRDRGAEVFVGINYAVDHVAGRIIFDEAPEAGADISAGFEFDVPVRFDTDRIAVSVASFQAGQVPDIPVVEVRV